MEARPGAPRVALRPTARIMLPSSPPGRGRQQHASTLNAQRPLQRRPPQLNSTPQRPLRGALRRAPSCHDHKTACPDGATAEFTRRAYTEQEGVGVKIVRTHVIRTA
jgi:hypothetical protein